ncbi:MAG: SDR family oxidoreductase [Candidatus Omnitrophota bacterium]|jgi:dTDP-4-dehydrorhamnose reductase|nr:SDR family oxidoreductase [Candidatus Omnitrophota bacterium]
MKLLLIGASGVFGSKFYNDAVDKKWGVLGTFCSHESKGLKHLDVTDKREVEKMFNLSNPKVVVWCGGVTDVDFCERKPKLAEDVNIKGTLNLIKRVKERDIKLIFLSTDYVFDGEEGPYKENDAPSPINVYGRTKLEAEEAIKGILKEFLIVRTAQLYGMDTRDNNFALKIIQNMRNKKIVSAADDFYCTPTYVGDLAAGVITLLEANKKGVYNVAGEEFLNRYEYVRKIAKVFSLDKSLIEKVKLKDLRLKAKRPKLAGLKVDKIISETGLEMLDCDDGLERLKKDLCF